MSRNLLGLLGFLGDTRLILRLHTGFRRCRLQWLHSWSFWSSRRLWSFRLLLWLRGLRNFSMFLFTYSLFDSGPLGSNVGEKPIKAVEGANDILIGFTTAIWPWSCWTRVEVNSRSFLFCTGSCELKILLEQFVITTPSETGGVGILRLWSSDHARIEALCNVFSLHHGM